MKISSPIGIDKNGFRHILEVNFNEYSVSGRTNWIDAEGLDLIELIVPEGITEVVCDHNILKELNLPKSVVWVRCDKDLFNYDECTAEWVQILYV